VIVAALVWYTGLFLVGGLFIVGVAFRGFDGDGK